ncbi:MAG: DUF4838 domain-containing protein [Clostridiales bacterium]|jgi:hypothetical protein|nr:DUF4838 domain-containing protein [Clostridiales bacterium]
MRKKITALCLLCLLTFMCGCHKPPPPEPEAAYDPNAGIGETVTDERGNAVYIASGGVSAYQIVYPARATAAEFYAANEMSDFIGRAAGAVLPVVSEAALNGFEQNKVISVGGTLLYEDAVHDDLSDAPLDSFLIKTDGYSVFIKGNNDRGTLYGVYDFLEKLLGVRFLTDRYTHVPTVTEFPLRALAIREEPSFTQRYFFAQSESSDAKMLSAFHARQRFVGEAGASAALGGPSEWCVEAGTAHNAATHYVSKSTYQDERFYSYAQYRADTGKPVNAGTYAEYIAGIDAYDNWFWEYINPATGGSQGMFDLCYTNGLTDDGAVDAEKEESVFLTALASLKRYVLGADKQDKQIKYFMFGSADIAEGAKGCPCSRCQRVIATYGTSGWYLRFVNRLAAEIDAWARRELDRSDIEVVMFAYAYVSKAPVKRSGDGFAPIDQTVRAGDNVRIRSALVDTNRYYSITDAKQYESYKTYMREWDAAAAKFCVWTYETSFQNYLVYVPVMQTFKENLTLFKQLNASYVMMQSTWNSSGHWSSLLNSYVASKMLWNPNRDVNALKAEFIELYYGPAAGGGGAGHRRIRAVLGGKRRRAFAVYQRLCDLKSRVDRVLPDQIFRAAAVTAGSRVRRRRRERSNGGRKKGAARQDRRGQGHAPISAVVQLLQPLQFLRGAGGAGNGVFRHLRYAGDQNGGRILVAKAGDAGFVSKFVAVRERRTMKDLKIYAFSSPPATREAYRQYAACGFNTALIDQNYAAPGTREYAAILDYCDEFGLKAYPMSYRPPQKWSAFPWEGDDTDYMAHKSFDGVFFWDEPGMADLDELASWIDGFEQKYPGKTFLVNLSCCYNDAALAARYPVGYDRVRAFFGIYAEKVLEKLSGPKILSTDYYPFLEKNGEKTMLHDYLWPFDAFSAVCEQRGYDFHFYIQASGGWNSECTGDPGDAYARDITSEAEITFQGLVCLSYGAGGIALFTYMSIDAFRYGALADQNGPTHRYAYAQAAIGKIKAFHAALTGFERVGTALLLGGTPAGYAVSAYKTLKNRLAGFARLKRPVCEADLLITEFRGAGKYAYLIVSYADPVKGGVCSVTFDVDRESLAVFDGAGGGRVTRGRTGYGLRLASGAGVLIVAE